jgi:predicted RNA-binding Zn-ribbon protein involved in translation (DUF1610 family)
MVDTERQVVCPRCQTAIPVEPEWRLVQCPSCGEMVSRMTEDRAYD